MREFKWPSERICLEVASKVDWKGEKAGAGIEGAAAASGGVPVMVAVLTERKHHFEEGLSSLVA